MKEFKLGNIQFPEKEYESNTSSVTDKNASVIQFLTDQRTDIKNSIEKLGVVLEYLVGFLALNEKGIVEYTKNFIQNDTFLLTNVADATKTLRNMLFLIEEDIEDEIK